MRTPVDRRRLATAGFVLALLGAALVACGEDDEPAQPGTSPETGPTGAPTGGATGEVAECVVGDWRSTEVGGVLGGDLGEVSLSGGADVALDVTPAGAATLDFSRMQPVELAGEVGGAELAGELRYTGRADAGLRTDTGTDTGTWEPVDTVDWSEVGVTLDLTSPFEGRPLDDVPLGEVVERADETTGEVVDVDPMLREGEFECRDGTLVLRPSDGAGMSWTLTRA